jgi:hypothetical protein
MLRGLAEGLATTTPRAPLTYRLISRLPGPFWLWTLLWATAGFGRSILNWLVLSANGDIVDAQRVLNNIPTTTLLLNLLVVVMLLGTRTLWRRAQDVQLNVVGDVDVPDDEPWSFHLISSTVGALSVTFAIAVAVDVAALVRFPAWFEVYDFPFLFFMTLPVGCFIWAFAAVLVSVDRIGQLKLQLEPFPRDRTLGLKPIGRLVLVCLGYLITGAGLYFLAQGRYLLELLIVGAVSLIVAAITVLSMWRLHRQMVQAKDGYVENARVLYVAAYEPLKRDPSMATLEARSRMLSAAESIEKRAESIHEWPIDDKTLARFAVVATSIATGLVLRVILTAVGL